MQLKLHFCLLLGNKQAEAGHLKFSPPPSPRARLCTPTLCPAHSRAQRWSTLQGYGDCAGTSPSELHHLPHWGPPHFLRSCLMRSPTERYLFIKYTHSKQNSKTYTVILREITQRLLSAAFESDLSGGTRQGQPCLTFGCSATGCIMEPRHSSAVSVCVSLSAR